MAGTRDSTMQRQVGAGIVQGLLYVESNRGPSPDLESSESASTLSAEHWARACAEEVDTNVKHYVVYKINLFSSNSRPRVVGLTSTLSSGTDTAT